MAFVLNNSTILNPSSFVPNRERIEVSERTAAGNLVTDVIAVKKVFTLTYRSLTGAQISTFLTLYDAGTYVSFSYPEGGSQQNTTVRVDNISHSLIYYTPTEYWSGVKIVLKEI